MADAAMRSLAPTTSLKDSCVHCGHPQAAHRAGGCVATRYEFVNHGPQTSGVNASPCRCVGFESPVKA